MNPFRKAVARFLVVSMSYLAYPAPAAHAVLIATDRVEQRSEQPSARERLERLLDRKAVLAQLEAHGVGAAEARARIAALSDEEVGRLAGKLDELPAGGEILELLFAVFVILLVTDILGFTKVFNFTRPVK